MVRSYRISPKVAHSKKKVGNPCSRKIVISRQCKIETGELYNKPSVNFAFESFAFAAFAVMRRGFEMDHNG